MAQNYKHVKTIQESVKIKGVISTDAKTIIYLDKNNNEIEIDITNCIKKYAGEEVLFSITTKDEEDIDEE